MTLYEALELIEKDPFDERLYGLFKNEERKDDNTNTTKEEEDNVDAGA